MSFAGLVCLKRRLLGLHVEVVSSLTAHHFLSLLSFATWLRTFNDLAQTLLPAVAVLGQVGRRGPLRLDRRRG